MILTHSHFFCCSLWCCLKHIECKQNEVDHFWNVLFILVDIQACRIYLKRFCHFFQIFWCTCVWVCVFWFTFLFELLHLQANFQGFELLPFSFQRLSLNPVQRMKKSIHALLISVSTTKTQRIINLRAGYIC